MIVIISGTNRPGSNTRKVASCLQEIYAGLSTGAKILDLADLPTTIFDPRSYARKPAEFTHFAQTVLQADGLVMVTPEYNGGMPGVLKYFIDMLKFPESFYCKPVCFVGLAAGVWGALRPVEQLQQIFGYRNAYIFPERVFLPGIVSLIGRDGQLTEAKLVERLSQQATGFIDFVNRFRDRQPV